MATTTTYPQLLASLYSADSSLTALKAMLCTSAHVPNLSTHRWKTSITNECSGGGYTAGGYSLTGVTLVVNAATKSLTIDANDLVTPVLTLPDVRYIIVYGAVAPLPLLFYIDLGGPKALAAEPLTVQWSADGLQKAIAV